MFGLVLIDWLFACFALLCIVFGRRVFDGAPVSDVCLPIGPIVVFVIDCCIFLCELWVVLAFGGFYIFFSWCVHYWDIKIVVVEYAVWSGWFCLWSIVLVYTLLILTEVLEKVFDVCCKRGGGLWFEYIIGWLYCMFYVWVIGMRAFAVDLLRVAMCFRLCGSV